MVALCLLAVSCNRNSKRYMSNISGKAGEIQVVCTKGNWEGDPGIAARNVLGGDFPYLPQTEPYYVLFNIPPTSFTDLFKVHRNILMLEVDPNLKKSKFEMRMDVWAAPQTVVSINSPSPDSLTKCIVDNHERLLNIFDQSERLRIINNAKLYENVEIRNKIARIFGGSPYFPNEYSIKKLTDNFAWVSYETTYTNQAVLMYKVPYLDSLWAQPDKILEQMNAVLKEQVPGMCVEVLKAPFDNAIQYRSASDCSGLLDLRICIYLFTLAVGFFYVRRISAPRVVTAAEAGTHCVGFAVIANDLCFILAAESDVQYVSSVDGACAASGIRAVAFGPFLAANVGIGTARGIDYLLSHADSIPAKTLVSEELREALTSSKRPSLQITALLASNSRA